MFIFLIICAICAGFVGIFLLSQATMGVGIIALGCLFGILARIVQASFHQEQLLNALNKSKQEDIEKQKD